MNLLDIDIKEYAQDIIDAYVEVYGERHRHIITQRFNRIVYITYNNPEGMREYVHYLENCKKKELSLKFLEKIGIDISKQQEKIFSEDLDEEYECLLQKYIGGYYLEFSKQLKNIPVGIRAWSEKCEEFDPEMVELGKISFLNFYRGENCKPITKQDFEEFCQTEEYNQILEKIQEYLKIYNEIVKEYEEYSRTLEPYRKYIREERKRKLDLEDETKKEFYINILNKLPVNIKSFLDSEYKSIEEKCEAFLGQDWEYTSYVEDFSEKSEDILNNLLTDEFDKESIYYRRFRYFIEMGVAIDKQRSEFITYKEFYEYCIAQEHIKKIMPTPNLAIEINKLRKESYEKFENEFIYTSEDFIKNIEKFGDNEENRKYLNNLIRKKTICITSATDENGFLTVMLYTIRYGEGGGLDYTFLHEGCHSIEAEKSIYENDDYRTGFDITASYIGRNPYIQSNRKYERMNETIADMLAMETLDVLHKKGIYIFEPKEIIDINIKNRNTNSILKNLLKRFMVRYRKEIIDARIDDVYIKKLYGTIGKENFEELNDLINKVDFLIECENLTWKLNNNLIEDPTVIEYKQQLKRLDNIYENMEQHKSQSENNRYERKITMSQLIAAINAKQKESKQNEYDDWGNKI